MSAETSRTTGPTPNEATRAKISEAYAAPSRELLTEKLILDHLPMVRHIVYRVVAHLSCRMDVEDLISAGTLGLVRAAKQFDPSRKVEFSTYAYIRVRGAVIDELRQRSFVSSAAHKRIRAVQAAYRQYVAANGRPPTEDELVQQVGMSRQQFYRTCEEARNQQFLSIYGLTEEGSALPAFLPPDKTPSPQKQLERKELIEELTRAIRELPEKERKVILLYYDRDLTMKEVAEVLEITESRVSQLHATALFKLSMRLRDLQ